MTYEQAQKYLLALTEEERQVIIALHEALNKGALTRKGGTHEQAAGGKRKDGKCRK